MRNNVLNIKFVDNNHLILKMPRDGLWTWFVLLDGYDKAFGYMVMVT